MRKLLLALSLLALTTLPASTQMTVRGVGSGGFSQGGGGGGGGGSGCSQATTFIARLDGTQNAAHNTAYTDLICGLVTDGLITGDLSTTGCGGVFDALYVLATNDTTNAVLNICSTSFGLTANGAPNFTVDTGYLGVDSSTTVYLNTNFNPTTASSPKFVQNSAHVMVWNNTNAAGTSTGFAAMGLVSPSNGFTNIVPKYSDNNAYFRINDNTNSGGIAVTDPRGMLVATRTASGTQVGYQCNVALSGCNNRGVTSVTSAAVVNGNIYILCMDQSGCINGTAHRIMAASIGSALNSTQAGQLYSRMNTYLVAIAGIAY